MQNKPQHSPRRNSLRRSPRARGWRRRSASETLEMAMALPLLLLLAFGTVEFGWWFYLEHNFQAAAREGARAAVVKADPVDQNSTAREAADRIMAGINIPPDKYEVETIAFDTDGNGVNDYLTVKIESDWSEIGMETGLFVKLRQGGQTELVDDRTKIRGTATMRIES